MFSFSILNITPHFILACKVSVDKSTYILMGSPLYVMSHLPLVGFKILSLPLTFDNLTTMCGFQPIWGPLDFINFISTSFTIFAKFSTIVALNLFSVFSYWDYHDVYLFLLMISHKSS